jgi:hypothetical protein
MSRPPSLVAGRRPKLVKVGDVESDKFNVNPSSSRQFSGLIVIDQSHATLSLTHTNLTQVSMMGMARVY